MAAAHLDDLRRLLRRAVAKVLLVDRQHAVVAPQPAVLGRQAAVQQVQHEHPGLIRPADQLDAQLLRRVALVQGDPQRGGAGRRALGGGAGGVRHRGRGGGGGGGGGRRRAGGAAALSEHGQLQGGAGPRQRGAGETVRDVADVHVVDLRGGKQEVVIRRFQSGISGEQKESELSVAAHG